jgi:hypothetical protein
MNFEPDFAVYAHSAQQIRLSNCSPLTTKLPLTTVNLSAIVLRLPNLAGNARIFKEVTVISPGFMNLDPFILLAPYYYYGHEHHLCDLRQKIARLRDRVSLLWKLLLF